MTRRRIQRSPETRRDVLAFLLAAPTIIITVLGLTVVEGWRYYDGGQHVPETSGRGRIAGLVFEDRNRNGTFDAADGPMAGQVVTLTRPMGTQRVTTSSDDQGAFHFDNLAPGRYRVTFSIPSGFARLTDDSFELEVADDGRVPQARFGLARHVSSERARP
jgi:hypothetical protein